MKRFLPKILFLMLLPIFAATAFPIGQFFEDSRVETTEWVKSETQCEEEESPKEQELIASSTGILQPKTPLTGLITLINSQTLPVFLPVPFPPPEFS